MADLFSSEREFDITALVSAFNECVVRCLDRCAPFVTRPFRRPPAPWFTPELRRSCRERDRLYRLARRLGSSRMLQEYKIRRRAIKALIFEARRAYLAVAVEAAPDQASVWSLLRREGVLPSSRGVVCDRFSPDVLNQHYAAVAGVHPPCSLARLQSIVDTVAPGTADEFRFSRITEIDVLGAFNESLMMMGASIPARAVTLRERILFGCVLLVGLFYSSSILAHLTSLNLDLQAHKKFETHRDLEESGLIPFLHPYAFNMTFRLSNDPTLQRLGKKAYLSQELGKCLGWLLNRANVSCIMARNRILNLLPLHSGRMKQAEPCFWSSYRTFIMRQGSPYTLSFNRMIRVAQESGIVSKWWRRFHEDGVSSSYKKNSVNELSQLIETNKRRPRQKNNSLRRSERGRALLLVSLSDLHHVAGLTLYAELQSSNPRHPGVRNRRTSALTVIGVFYRLRRLMTWPVRHWGTVEEDRVDDVQTTSTAPRTSDVGHQT
ncbi:unnamed protein product [Trichogramma brassicae]|uniref:Uncharacterized protein n=1 Tax=Trichogramma brassicae TaxID=86971 RepID=A0A6H5IES3_9HYME|nr:unnamed protein product [Trichogramma brassicae]